MHGTLDEPRGRPWLASGSGRGRRRRAESATASSTGPAAAMTATRFAGSFRTKRLATLRAAWIERRACRRPRPDLSSSQTEPLVAPTLRRGARTLAGVPRRRRRGDHAVRHRDRARTGRCRCSATAYVDELTAAPTSPPSSPRCPRGATSARDDPQDAADARDDARPRRRHAEPGARPVESSCRARSPRRSTRRPPSTSRPSTGCSRRGTGCRCCGSTGQAPASRAIDLTLVGDYDEPRRRVRLRAATTKTRQALWVELPPVLADALEAQLGPREDRDPDARLFAGSRRGRAPHVDREGVQGRRRSRSGRRTTCATGGSRCCTCAACRGRGSASSSGSATSPSPPTRTRTSCVDEAELDYAKLLA